MKTIKEVCELTGVSARTLRWYDKMGLLKPSAYTQAGYRLYDEKAMETLHQILFFREFDLSLKEIKGIMENPDFNREAALKDQIRVLELKKERLEHLIFHLEEILRGDSKMDFAVFDKTEIEAMCHEMIANLNEKQLEKLKKTYGSLDAVRKMYQERMNTPEIREQMGKMVQWYGSKEKFRKATFVPCEPEVVLSRANRIIRFHQKLAEKKELNPASPQVQEIIGEMVSVMKGFSQIEHIELPMLEMAEGLKGGTEAAAKMDEKYGEGMAEFFRNALLAFFKN